MGTQRRLQAPCFMGGFKKRRMAGAGLGERGRVSLDLGASVLLLVRAMKNIFATVTISAAMHEVHGLSWGGGRLLPWGRSSCRRCRGGLPESLRVAVSVVEGRPISERSRGDSCAALSALFPSGWRWGSGLVS